ncbi:MAG: MBL fold metallo-hydrolase [Akkermansiaceae bacterium]|nr:MBL fold metallo-hydrolase [Akkermansiaceae bacterium]
MREVVQLHGLFFQHSLIVLDNGVALIEEGFLDGIFRIKIALIRHGKTQTDVRSIILTHGHLDHTLNVTHLQKLTGYRVFAPRLDLDHAEGRHPYRGWSRVSD